MQKAYNLILSLLATKVPRLYTHLFSQSSGLGLSPHEILEPMIRTLFLAPGQGLGIEIASRVWDVMILDGDAVVMRTAVAVLAGLEGKLYGTREEVLGMLGWGGKGGLRAEGDEVENFMGKVRAAGKEGRLKMGKEKADGVVGRI